VPEKANHLAAVIDVDGAISASGCDSTQVAEVRHRAVLPKCGVKTEEIGQVAIGLKSRASARRANSLAVVIDGKGDSVRIGGNRGQFPCLAILPDDGLELELLILA
jgi:hypothetical protein